MICYLCKKDLGHSLQQPFYVNNKIRSAHFNCGHEFLEREIVVYKVEFDGTSFLDKNIDCILDMIKDSDLDNTYTITKIKIKEHEYGNLEEFTGF